MSEDNSPKQEILNPNDMTREQLENELKTQTGLSPEDVAAAFFQLEYPRFKGMLSVLSRNELERLCLNLAAKELVPDANKLKTDKERSAMYLGDQMIFNRVVMQLTVEMQKAEEAQKILEQNKTEETNTQGESNV